MIYLGSHSFEVIEGKNKTLKLRAISDDEMGPYRTNAGGGTKFTFSPAIAEAYRAAVLKDLLFITKKIYNEGYLMKESALRELENLAKYYDFVTVVAWFERYWQERDNLAQIHSLNILAKRRAMEENNILTTTLAFVDDIKLSDDWPDLKSARIAYLEQENTYLSTQIKEAEQKLTHLEDKDCDLWLIDIAAKLSDHEKTKTLYNKNKIDIAYLKDVYKDSKQVITDEMISAAKRSSWDKLLKLEIIAGRKRCKCPFHNEKTPSFYIYPDTNRGYCHGCGRSVDTIQYLVEINKLRFNQAVLTLLSY